MILITSAYTIMGGLNMKHPITSEAISSRDSLLEKTQSYHTSSSLLAFDGAIQAVAPIDMFEIVLAQLQAKKIEEKDKKEAQESIDSKAEDITEEKAISSEDENAEEQPKNNASTAPNDPSADNSNNTEANVGGDASSLNRYPTPLPDPLSIRDGWDEDYADVGIGNNALVISEERNLNISAPTFYIPSFYEEIQSTQASIIAIAESCNCDCDLSGVWTLWFWVDYYDFENTTWEVSINSWTLDFGNGQTFTSDTGVYGDSENLGIWQPIPLLVENFDCCNMGALTVHLDMSITDFNYGDFEIAIEAPNYLDITLIYFYYTELEDEYLNVSGTYSFTDDASQYFGVYDDYEGPESIEPGSYLPDGWSYNFFNYISMAEFLEYACDPDFYSGGMETAPIVFDLEGDGFDLLSIEEANILFDVDNDGVKEQTAWFGANDGVLVFDLLDDQQVTNVNEFAFANWHPDAKSDLEGLQLVFDTNKDNQLDAQDEPWSQMGIWQDRNQNGITDEGEYSSLDDLGIISISLNSDGQLQMMNGNTILGTVTAQKSNGESISAADVILSYSEVAIRSSEPVAELVAPLPIMQEMVDTSEQQVM